MAKRGTLSCWWLVLALGASAAPFAGCASAPRPHPIEPITEDSPVIVYGCSWCRATTSAVAWLQAHHIPHVVHDVERDLDRRAEMTRKVQSSGARGAGIPVLDVGGRILIGFEGETLARALRGEE